VVLAPPAAGGLNFNIVRYGLPVDTGGRSSQSPMILWLSSDSSSNGGNSSPFRLAGSRSAAKGRRDAPREGAARRMGGASRRWSRCAALGIRFAGPPTAHTTETTRFAARPVSDIRHSDVCVRRVPAPAD
jgi:hypothetical protein